MSDFIPDWSKEGEGVESNVADGICKRCDKPVVYSETGDDDEVCRRYKPYCLNHDNQVDWRARAIEALSTISHLTAELQRVGKERDEALEAADAEHTLLAKERDEARRKCDRLSGGIATAVMSGHATREHLRDLCAETEIERDALAAREQQLVRDINREKYQHIATIKQRDEANKLVEYQRERLTESNARAEHLAARVGDLEKERQHCHDLWSEAETERMDARAEVERLKTRQAELLSAIVRLTNETPFSDEAKDALEQRGKLVAEIGTLKAQVVDWKRQTSTALVRAATAEDAVNGLTAELARMRPVYEAAVRFPDSYGGKLVEPPGDWACKECKPCSDWPRVDNGWQCPVHALLSAIVAVNTDKQGEE